VILPKICLILWLWSMYGRVFSQETLLHFDDSLLFDVLNFFNIYRKIIGQKKNIAAYLTA
jgi:hypothetical protein